MAIISFRVTAAATTAVAIEVGCVVQTRGTISADTLRAAARI
jgi:hypothetical protein